MSLYFFARLNLSPSSSVNSTVSDLGQVVPSVSWLTRNPRISEAWGSRLEGALHSSMSPKISPTQDAVCHPKSWDWLLFMSSPSAPKGGLSLNPVWVGSPHLLPVAYLPNARGTPHSYKYSGQYIYAGIDIYILVTVLHFNKENH